ncbi:hypothetical protein ACFWGD_06865 [Corynebacterium sp. NPDC060344]|uniref:hypothetical protein n=1 Tax=Corynebacterium sp. NPDC060344 TaxID=3347101 RepID=UPI003669A4E6
MATPDETERILAEHLQYIEDHPEEFPQNLSLDELIERDMAVHARSVIERQPGGWRAELERWLEAGKSADGLDDSELLIEVLRDSLANGAPAETLEQILRSVNPDDTKLIELYESETAPSTAHARFRFIGEGVEGHSMNATALGNIVTGIAEATRHVALDAADKIRKDKRKNRTSLGEHAQPVLVGAVSPGSVVIELSTTAHAADVGATGEDGFDLSHPPTTLDDQALRTVVEALTSEGDATALDELPKTAREALHLAAKSMRDEHIDAEITIRQRRRSITRANVTRSGVTTLVHALEVPRITTEHLEAPLELDGWKGSEEVIYLKSPKQKSLAYHASKELMRKVRLLQKDPNFVGWLLCDISITRTEKPGKKSPPARREVHALFPIPAPSNAQLMLGATTDDTSSENDG